MRLSIVTTAVACACGAGGLGAQQDAAPEDRLAHEVYLLQGCLEEGPATAEIFTLSDATANGPAPPTAQAESGETGEPQATYQLRPVAGFLQSGVEADELRAHVGYRVEVTVRPPDPAPEPETAPVVTETGDPAGSDIVPEPAPPVFTVAEIRRQGEQCG